MPDELVKTVFHVAAAPAAAIEAPPVAVAPTTATEAAIADRAPPSQSQVFIVIPSCVSTKGRTVRHLPSVCGAGQAGRPVPRVEQSEKDTFGRARAQLPRGRTHPLPRSEPPMHRIRLAVLALCAALLL